MQIITLAQTFTTKKISMGLFDFFKKKSKSTTKIEPKEIVKKVIETTPPVLEPKKEPTTINPVQEKQEEPIVEIPKKETAPKKVEEIIIAYTDNGSHGDNFGGLIGFNLLNSEDGSTFINEYIALSVMRPSVLTSPLMEIKETRFGENSKLGIRTLFFNEKIPSAYPYLQTNIVLPFATKTITEWSHAGNFEAEIEGGGRDTFGLSFFATDYAVNRNKYRSEKKLNIKLSAIALVLEKSDLKEVNGTPVSADFSTYMPCQNLKRITYFDFIGLVLDFKPIDITASISGYIVTVRLISNPEDPNFFNIDLFINKENMRFSDLEKGMKVTGALWFQGEIE